METKIQVLKSTELFGQQFAVYGTAENPLFVATQVAEMLSLTNVSDMIGRIDVEERSKFNLGRQGETWFLTEDGLYEVLMQSRKPIAKQFKKGVKDILKSVRKRGGYLTPEAVEETLTNPDFIIKLATSLKDERAKRIEAEAANERSQMYLQQANSTIIEQAPKVKYFDEHMNSKGLVTTNIIAEGLGISHIKLNKLLCEWGIQYKQSGCYFLYSKYRNKGYEQQQPYTHNNSHGEATTTYHMYWKPAGRKFIIELYKNKIAL
jgi:prophage antirepressor-like protein